MSNINTPKALSAAITTAVRGEEKTRGQWSQILACYAADNISSNMLYAPKGEDAQMPVKLLGEMMTRGDLYNLTENAIIAGFEAAEQRLIKADTASARAFTDEEKAARTRAKQKVGAYLGNMRKSLDVTHKRIEAEAAMAKAAAEGVPFEQETKSPTRKRALNVAVAQDAQAIIKRLQNADGNALGTLPDGAQMSLIAKLKEVIELCEKKSG